MPITRKPVELGNDQQGAALPAFSEGCKKLGPVVLASALHFDELRGPVALAT